MGRLWIVNPLWRSAPVWFGAGLAKAALWRSATVERGGASSLMWGELRGTGLGRLLASDIGTVVSPATAGPVELALHVLW